MSHERAQRERAAHRYGRSSPRKTSQALAGPSSLLHLRVCQRPPRALTATLRNARQGAGTPGNADGSVNVRPGCEQAEAALIAAKNTPMPERPTGRRSLRTWVNSAYLLLVFGGFMSPSTAEPLKRPVLDRLRAVFSFLLAAAIWVMTWVVPFTFMIMMAWGCETHARQLGRRALVYYDGEAASVNAAIALAARRRDRGHDKRTLLRAIALFFSVAIPLGFIGVVNHYRNTLGFNWLAALGSLVALSLVIATAVIASRR